jgi:hypothetical protein
MNLLSSSVWFLGHVRAVTKYVMPARIAKIQKLMSAAVGYRSRLLFCPAASVSFWKVTHTLTNTQTHSRTHTHAGAHKNSYHRHQNRPRDECVFVCACACVDYRSRLLFLSSRIRLLLERDVLRKGGGGRSGRQLLHCYQTVLLLVQCCHTDVTQLSSFGRERSESGRTSCVTSDNRCAEGDNKNKGGRDLTQEQINDHFSQATGSHTHHSDTQRPLYSQARESHRTILERGSHKGPINSKYSQERGSHTHHSKESLFNNIHNKRQLCAP